MREKKGGKWKARKGEERRREIWMDVGRKDAGEKGSWKGVGGGRVAGRDLHAASLRGEAGGESSSSEVPD